MRVTTAVAVGVMLRVGGMAAGVAQRQRGPVPSNAAAALVNPHAAVACGRMGSGSEGRLRPRR